MECILLTTNNDLKMVNMNEEQLFNNYDLYCPRHKIYFVSFAVKL
jgi:hypothetical protein